MYQSYVTRIKNLRKHSNADRLLVGECFGNNVIVSLDYIDNQLGIYFPTDGKLGEEYAKKNKLIREKDEDGNNVGGYLDPSKRNVVAIKLRGEKSDGLFMPLESLNEFCNIAELKEGDTITVINGIVICEKYIPSNNHRSFSGNGKVKTVKKIVFPFFEEHVDTEQLAYNLNEFKVGDLCTITLKMHGTSARTSNSIKVDNKQNFFQKLFNLNGKEIRKWDYVSGSRRVVLDFSKPNVDGYYGDNDFRHKWHEAIVPKLQKGEEIFYEIVGWVNESTLVMSECKNKKTNDKEFVKKYGETTRFIYGCEQGQNDVYVYRMTKMDEDGNVVEYPTWLVQRRCEEMGLKFVPVFEQFFFTTQEDLLSRVEEYYDGEDPIGKNHIREGAVVRIENKVKFKAYKHKNFNFKVLEGIIKDTAIQPDMEEAQEEIVE